VRKTNNQSMEISMTKTLFSKIFPAFFAVALLILGPGAAWAGPQDGASFPLHKAYRSGAGPAAAAAQEAAKSCPMCEEAARKADDRAKSMSCPCCAGMAMPSQKSGDAKMSCCDGMKSGGQKACCD
jgi:hypothetical protein